MDCLLAAIPIHKPKTHYTKLHLAILEHYITFLHTMSEQDLPHKFISDSAGLKKISEPYAQELKKFVFTVPRLKKLPEGQHGILKYRAVKEFISFLARLLYQKPGSIEIKNLDKELRFLLTVLGDTSLLACADEQQEFENLLEEFEAVAKEAGNLVHSLLFRTDRAFGEIDDGSSAVVVNHVNLLKANIIRLSHIVPCMSRSSYKTSVLDSVLVLDSLVRDLEDLMNRDDNLIVVVGVKDQIRTLHHGLICLQPFIKDTGSPQDQLKEYCMRIGDLAHQAQRLIVSILAGDAPPWYLINRLTDINHKIELCRIELPEITMEYNSGALKVPKYFNKKLSSSLPNRNTEANDDIVGSEDSMTYILDHLLGGGAGLRVISLFGMPGLGKTTLAKKLYNHPSVDYRFDKLSWCVVSQTYLRRNVLSNILIQIASELDKEVILEMEEDSLAERVYKTLKGRRYLIVMDDIWDSNVCDELLRCFPDDGNGSRILFTTRNKNVVPPNCIMYRLPSLSDGQCWELIQKKVFHNRPCPPELVESGQELAVNCRGMPLAAVVIAGILLTVDKQESAWEEVRRNLSSYILDDGDSSVMRILKLSYDHLPQHLKLCFLYFGVYFEFEEISAQQMKDMWIAEGFIHGENQKEASEEYLKELIDRSLVIIGRRRSNGGPKTCLIHDLLRELCLKTYQEEKLTRFLNYNKYLENVEDNQKIDMNNSTTWMCCKYMRNRFGQYRTHGYKNEDPDIRLSRVFYFDSGCIYWFRVEYLVCLKYLVVCDFPPSIGSLVNLEYLCVLSNKMVYLPSAIMKMKKLKYVEVTARAIYRKDCNTISHTNNIEYLSNVVIKTGKHKNLLKCSPRLTSLKCLYSNRFHRLIDLSFLTRLESLTLRLLGGVMVMSLPSSIKKLTLRGYMNKLSRKTMSMIGRLENLEVLKLSFMYFEGNKWDTRDGEFQKLRYLMLHSMSFTQWNVGSSQHFPKLQQLEMSLCHKLGRIPAEIGEIPTLQIIGVDRWLKKSARRVQQEQRDMGNEEIKVAMTSYLYRRGSFPRVFGLFIITSLLSVYLSTATFCSDWKSTHSTDYAATDPVDVVSD